MTYEFYKTYLCGTVYYLYGAISYFDSVTTSLHCATTCRYGITAHHYNAMTYL